MIFIVWRRVQSWTGKQPLTVVICRGQNSCSNQIGLLDSDNIPSSTGWPLTANRKSGDGHHHSRSIVFFEWRDDVIFLFSEHAVETWAVFFCRIGTEWVFTVVVSVDPKNYSCLVKIKTHSMRGIFKNEIFMICQLSFLNFDLLALISFCRLGEI